MTELPEDRVYVRHPRRTGAVLIVGAGAVGGLLSEELARLGISPLTLVDKDVLKDVNLVRHPLGEPDLGKPKASALAARINRDFSLCDARGFDVDFLQLPPRRQLALVREADVVVAATDEADCQRRVNEVCIEAEKPAVYPGIWVGEHVRDAEVSEILWVLPGRHTPCYLCATSWRPTGAGAEARGGTRADIQVLVLATLWAVAGLLDANDERARILDPERTLILVHGFMTPSHAVRDIFSDTNIRSIRVPFPQTSCPACGGREVPAPPPRPVPIRPVPARPIPVQPHPPVQTHTGNGKVWASMAAVFLVLLVIIVIVTHHRGSAPTTTIGQPGSQIDSQAPASTSSGNGPTSSSGQSNGWSSGQQVDNSNNSFSSISCLTTGFCMAVDGGGNVYSYSNGSWSSGQQVDNSGNGLTAISCPTSTFCVATSSAADAYIYSSGNWSSSSLVGADGGPANLKSVSCPTAGVCFAAGSWNVYTYSNGAWATGQVVQQQNWFTSISCPTTSFCVAVDNGGDAYSYSNGSWSSGQQLDSSGLTSVSCASASFCAAIDSGNNAYIDSNGTWTTSQLVGADGNAANLTGVSCPTVGFCLATGGLDVYVYSGNAWATGYVVQQNNTLVSISCPTTSSCMAVDNSGQAYAYSGS